MHFSTVKHIVCAYAKRNEIIFKNLNRKASPNTVNLHWWDIGASLQNVGDLVSPTVVDHMKRQNQITNDNVGKTKHLYAVGSIIDAGFQDATVWGSGLIQGKQSYWWKHLRKLDLRCVRGPKTREALVKNGYKCPEIYGDPAVLMPLIYQPPKLEKKYAYRVVPHYSRPCKYPNALSSLVLDHKSFIDEIVSSELIISSSLHGIILAEAYGVPAILLGHDMSMFKYCDYYYSTERTHIPIASSVEEALNMSVPPLPCLDRLRENLVNSFPADLWDK